MKGIVITADDFGADIAVNEAVERAHLEGILTAASLMVAGPAAADAIERARRMPKLGVGLHLVLTDGKAILPPEQIPALVDSEGNFRTSMVRSAFDIARSSATKAQLRAEIEAQFVAFAATGLPLDHVNTHKHFHLHPHIAEIIIEVGKPYGMRAMRVPRDRKSPMIMEWLSKRLARRLSSAGILANRQVYGLAASGKFDKLRMQRVLSKLPNGLSELYCHPATLDSFPGSAPGYHYLDELEALLDPVVAGTLRRGPAVTGNFRKFSDPEGPDWFAFAAAANTRRI